MQVLVVLPPTLNGGVTKPVGSDVGMGVEPATASPSKRIVEPILRSRSVRVKCRMCLLSLDSRPRCRAASSGRFLSGAASTEIESGRVRVA